MLNMRAASCRINGLAIQIAAMTVACLSGCVAPRTTATGNADASVSGLRAEVGEVSAGLFQLRHEVTAGRDVTQNDAWTMRLLGAGLLVLGLTYPVGKLVWIVSRAVSRKAMRLVRPRAVPGARWVAFGRRRGHPRL